MKIETTSRGFNALLHEAYPAVDLIRLAVESSAVGDYPDSLDNPGSSFLWIGQHHHLNREEVKEFCDYLQRWLETGSLQ